MDVNFQNFTVSSQIESETQGQCSSNSSTCSTAAESISWVKLQLCMLTPAKFILYKRCFYCNQYMDYMSIPFLSPK